MKKEIILFDRKEDCCGCAACANICPRQAIEMKNDEYGFSYPVIVSDQCIGCGLCKNVCAFGKENAYSASHFAYAVQAKEETLLSRSASGGVFAMLAEAILSEGGVAVGCALEREEDTLRPHHIVIETADELYKLQGSKYVQSDTGYIYNMVRKILSDGRRVLFSGTPCQVAGLYGFLGEKKHPNLLTVDLICHGTPSADMFSDYISVLEKKLKGKVLDFTFRDKSEGWRLNGSVMCEEANGIMQKKTIASYRSSYYNLFLAQEIYRDSCYRCPYASLSRPGDLTIGDFWGIEKQHPEILSQNGGAFVKEKGISCVLVNSEQGNAAMEMLVRRANVTVSKAEAVAAENKQLNHPSVPGKNRDKILSIYRKHGYEAVEKWFFRYQMRRKIKKKLLGLVPKKH